MRKGPRQEKQRDSPVQPIVVRTLDEIPRVNGILWFPFWRGDELVPRQQVFRIEWLPRFRDDVGGRSLDWIVGDVEGHLLVVGRHCSQLGELVGCCGLAMEVGKLE